MPLLTVSSTAERTGSLFRGRGFCEITLPDFTVEQRAKSHTAHEGFLLRIPTVYAEPADRRGRKWGWRRPQSLA